MRVLVVRNDKIGDLVLALPLVAALKRAGHAVGVLASPYAAPLLEKDPRVDRLLRTGDSLKGFDAALVLWGNWRNAAACWLAGIPRRYGISARPFSFLFSARLALRRSGAERHESDYNLDFGRALGLEARIEAPSLKLGRQDQAAASAALKRLGLKKPVILHPGSRGSAQNWEPGRYSELGRALARRFKAPLLVTAGPGEEGMAAQAARACGARVAGALPLRAFAALCGMARLFVSASTGPMHLAAAGGAPTLSLFPPLRAMSPRRWGPRGNRHAVLLPEGLGTRISDKGENFVERISVKQALDAAEVLCSVR